MNNGLHAGTGHHRGNKTEISFSAVSYQLNSTDPSRRGSVQGALGRQQRSVYLSYRLRFRTASST